MSNVLNFGELREARIAEWLRSFVELPVFESEEFQWLNASEMKYQFNYTATKNFTIRELPEPPTNVNFCLVISYRVGQTKVRYKLWSGIGEVLNEPLYNGQVIKKNFSLEIWSTSVSFVIEPEILIPHYKVSLDEAINIKTSIRTIPDTYASLDEYADNTVLGTVTPAQQVITFGTQASPPTANLAGWWKARDGGLITDLSGNGRNNTGAVTVDNGITVGTLNRQALNYLGGGAAFTEFTVKQLFAICKIGGWNSGTKILSWLNNAAALETYVEQITGTPQARGVRPIAPTNTGLFNLTLNADTVVGFIHNPSTPPAFGTYQLVNLGAGFTSFNNFSTDVAVNALGKLGNMTLGSNVMNIAEILAFTDVLSDDDLETLQAYLVQEYFSGAILFPGEVTEDVMWLDNP